MDLQASSASRPMCSAIASTIRASSRPACATPASSGPTRRISAGQPDDWDHATRLELAVLGRDEDTATSALENALAAVREKWEPESTARNLRLIRRCREKRGEPLAWAAALERAPTSARRRSARNRRALVRRTRQLGVCVRPVAR
jgi:hypothetical protein